MIYHKKNAGKYTNRLSVEGEPLDVFYWQTPQKEHNWIIDKLIEKSKEPHIVEATPKDKQKRFKDIDVYCKWSQQRKLIIGLGSISAKELAGIIWFSESENYKAPEFKSTFAIRLYQGYTGRGLAKPFMEVAHEVFKEQSSENLEENNGIWLETDRENLPAINLYRAFGYSELTKSDEGRLLMTYNIS